MIEILIISEQLFFSMPAMADSFYLSVFSILLFCLQKNKKVEKLQVFFTIFSLRQKIGKNLLEVLKRSGVAIDLTKYFKEQ